MPTSDEFSNFAMSLDPLDLPAAPAGGGGATVISLLDRLPPAAPSRRWVNGSDMVEGMSDRIDVMAGRTRELETYVQHFEKWSAAQLDAVEMVADHWKNVTAVAEMKIEQLQRSLEASKHRAEVAECDLQNVRYRLELLHDRIAKVFGSTARLRATCEVTAFD